MRKLIAVAMLMLGTVFASEGRAEVKEITITRVDHVGFLPLLVMERKGIIEKKAAEAGVDLKVNWVSIAGSGAVNDALLSGSAQFISGGIPGILTLWDRTKGKQDIVGVGSISSQPLYLNTNSEKLKSLDDLSEADKVAVATIKISIPSIIMQMYAREKYGEAETFRFDPLTVAMGNPEAVAALVSGGGAITAHYTSAPFHQLEIRDPKVHTIHNSYDVMGGPTSFAIMATTAKFREENPLVFKAVFDALAEGQAFIHENKKESAQILLDAMGGRGWDVDQLLEILNDPNIKFDITPENVMRYANFMADVGSLKNRLGSWSELFAEEAQSLSGS